MIFKNNPWKIIIGGLAIACLSWWVANPLVWPDSWMHAWLLKKVPVGSSEDHFLEVIKAEGWRLKFSWIPKNHQLNARESGGFDMRQTPLHGDKFYSIYMGNFRFILREDVQTFWAFDDKGCLIDVRIQRDVDAP
jgi:hypothetical protein